MQTFAPKPEPARRLRPSHPAKPSREVAPVSRHTALRRQLQRATGNQVLQQWLPSATPTHAGGESLSQASRNFFEPRFGHDFGSVRVHTRGSLGASVQQPGARAMTTGTDITFKPGHYAPGTTRGRWLLGHELAHVVQQSGAGASAARRDGHEGEADRAATAALAGAPVRVAPGTVRTGTPQFDEGTAGQHPGKLPTPETYIANHTRFFDLKEARLASSLYLLVWQSSGHYDFVFRVLNALSKDNQQEVSTYFFKQLGGDSWLQQTALTAKGRTFLTALAAYLPDRSAQRKRVTKIVKAGPQNQREKERIAALDALKKTGKTVDISFYTEYKGMDNAESILGDVAKKRLAQKKTDAAFPMAAFDDISDYLEAISKKYKGATNFVRGLHLMGHGIPDNFGFGKHYYNSAYLKSIYKTGQNAKYMADGATIFMEGCNVAKGETGRQYLKQIGRIFFGDHKKGFIKGNTCTIMAMGDLTECGPRTLRWPRDFK